MEIIDSQVHIYGPNVPAQPWDPSYGAVGGLAMARAAGLMSTNTAITGVDMTAAMDAAAVDAAVLVATSHYGWDNTYSLQAAKAHPDRFRVVGRVNPLAADVTERLDEWAATPYAVGLRLLLMDDLSIAKLAAGSYGRYLAHAEKLEIPICVFPPGRLSVVGMLATRYPQLQLVVDHLGLPQPAIFDIAENPFEDLAALVELGRHPNVAVKLTALPALSKQGYPFTDVWAAAQAVLAAFGADRVMWGSDWTRIEGVTYREHVDLALDTKMIPDPDRERVVGKTLRRIFRW